MISVALTDATNSERIWSPPTCKWSMKITHRPVTGPADSAVWRHRPGPQRSHSAAESAITGGKPCDLVGTQLHPLSADNDISLRCIHAAKFVPKVILRCQSWICWGAASPALEAQLCLEMLALGLTSMDPVGDLTAHRKRFSSMHCPTMEQDSYSEFYWSSLHTVPTFGWWAK